MWFLSEKISKYYPALIQFHIHFLPVRENQEITSEARENTQRKWVVSYEKECSNGVCLNSAVITLFLLSYITPLPNSKPYGRQEMSLKNAHKKIMKNA